MHVTFENIHVGGEYSRQELSELWDCRSYHALARGVVTPAGDNKIILFVTETKQNCSEPYDDRLVDRTLHWEGPNDHFAEDRMLAADGNGDEIHVFHRQKHHSDFVYLGRVQVADCQRMTDKPSRFVLVCRR